MLEELQGPFLDVMGRYRTNSLFFETNTSREVPIFTTKPYNHEVNGVMYYSLKLLYMELSHAPYDGEYEFAIEVFGSWDQWQRICANADLGKLVEKWRIELEVKVRSKSLKALIETATEEGSKGTTAAKWIASGQWRSGKGRPTNEEKKKRAAIEAGVEEELSEDAERLGLH